MSRQSRKPVRTPVGRRNILTVEDTPGYKTRVVNDEPGRIAMFEAAGYEVVKEKTQVGDENAGRASQVGSVAQVPVGGGQNAVVMRIKEEWYEEDQAAKEARLKEKEQGLLLDKDGKQPDQSNLYGEGLEINKGSSSPMVKIN